MTYQIVRKKLSGYGPKVWDHNSDFRFHCGENEKIDQFWPFSSYFQVKNLSVHFFPMIFLFIIVVQNTSYTIQPAGTHTLLTVKYKFHWELIEWNYSHRFLEVEGFLTGQMRINQLARVIFRFYGQNWADMDQK